MTPVFLPRVKLALRSVTIDDCVDLWTEVRAMGDAESVRERVRNFVRNSNGAREKA